MDEKNGSNREMLAQHLHVVTGEKRIHAGEFYLLKTVAAILIKAANAGFNRNRPMV
jgi:hypothetical protein